MRSRDPRRHGGHQDENYRDSNHYHAEYYAGEYYSNEYCGDDARHGIPSGRAGIVVRAARVVSGIVTGAVLALMILVCGAHYLGGNGDFPGPGTESVVAHVVAAVVAVVAQVIADRRRGPISVAAAIVVVFTASILLITQWWG
jgi:4-hydroxybenzoate polyprenyltransferase